MDEHIKQLEYIRSQLAWIKSKVELDNQLGLHDINKLGEDIFMHILNDVYDLNLKNANDILHDDFPSIDLVDEINKKVIQVTSTKTIKKARNTVEKLKELKFHEITDSTSESLKNSISFFRQLKNYKNYQLSFLYLNQKPNIKTDVWKKFLEEEKLDENDILGIEDIINIIQANPTKCQTLYKTIQQRMDNISFKFNIHSYFEQAETHLESITNDKFKKYDFQFIEFIESETKILEVYAVGGSGKSHLLRYFSDIETEYIPLIFTKQVNIEEDLNKLDSNKKYLFIFDDIDRFLDQPILINLLSYTINMENVKLLLSFRTASKNMIKAQYRRYNHLKIEELEIIWEQDEIESLIESLLPELEERKIKQLAYEFNNNPYIITQAIHGNMQNIEEFSKKVVDDTQRGLEEFKLNNKEIRSLLFELSLLSPISKNNISKDYKSIVAKLVEKKILRELASKYRFNPDMIGDLYLANYIDENKDDFEQIVESKLTNFSDALFTNLSYALVYNKSDSLQNFIKKIINRWIEKQEYSNNYLALINKVIYYAPMESFIYLEKATKQLNPKPTNDFPKSDLMSLVSTVSTNTNLYNSDSDAINLESIEPIIVKLINALKNNVPCEELNIEHVIRYLTSEKVLNLPKAYYDNQTLESIFAKLASPLNILNFDVILQSLKFMENWLYEEPINSTKIYLLKKATASLLNATYETTTHDSGQFTTARTELNLKHKKVLEIIEYAKNIFLRMLQNDNEKIIHEVLDSIIDIGGYHLYRTTKENQEFYVNIQKELLLECIELLKRKDNIKITTKIEDIAMHILRFSSLQDEALKVLSEINRDSNYLFYQIVKNTDVLIFNFKEFYDECMKQDDIREWIHQNELHKIKNKEPSNIELEKVIKSISKQYKTYNEYLILLNNLNISSWNSNHLLLQIFRKWLKDNNSIFIDTVTNHLEKIENKKIQNIIKESLLLEGLSTIDINNITENTKEEDIRIYINLAYRNYTSDSIKILQTIINVSQAKEPKYLGWIISIMSGDMYFKIRENIELYKDFEPLIIQFLDWQIQYNLNVESYITHHILYDLMLPLNKIPDAIKDKLVKIITNNNIFINDFELQPIYKMLDYNLENVIANLYDKLIYKEENGKYKHYFTHYFDNDKISEVLLIKSYINSYEDFKILINKTLDYYTLPIEDGMYINFDYFIKNAIKQEYLEQYFEELYEDNDIDKIKILYVIVPISKKYLNIIIKNLNLLDGLESDNKLIEYLIQIGKIKSWSRSHMQNSDLVLNEEDIFTKIFNSIDSLPLQLKLKKELQNIEIQKRQEIEEDIARLLVK